MGTDCTCKTPDDVHNTKQCTAPRNSPQLLRTTAGQGGSAMEQISVRPSAPIMHRMQLLQGDFLSKFTYEGPEPELKPKILWLA